MGGARVSEFFYKESKSKLKKNSFFFFFFFWGGGGAMGLQGRGGYGATVSVFTKNTNLKKKILWGGQQVGGLE